MSMGPYKSSKKIFVVITGRDNTSPGIYASWKTAQSHIQGIKKISGIVVEWNSFEGAQRDTESLLYWHSHYKEPPSYPDQRRQNPTPTPASAPKDHTPAKTRSKALATQTFAQEAPPQAPTQQSSSIATDTDKSSQKNNTPNPSRQPPHPPQGTHTNSRDILRAAVNYAHGNLYSGEVFPERKHNDTGDSGNTRANWHEHLRPGERHWSEEYLQLRIRQIKQLRLNLPTPPATEPVDRRDILESIVSQEWLENNAIPVPSALVDSEYSLTSDYYRRVLYTENWDEKDHHISVYLTTIDAKRDHHLQTHTEITFQCLDRHSKHVRRTAHDAAHINTSQSIQKNLFENNQKLELSVTRLRRDLAAEKKKNFHFLQNDRDTQPLPPNSQEYKDQFFPPKRVTYEESLSTPTVSTTYTNKKGESSVQTIFASVMPTVKSPPPVKYQDDISETSTPPSSPESLATTDTTSAYPHLLRKSVSFDPALFNSDTPQQFSPANARANQQYITRYPNGTTVFGLPEGLTESEARAFHLETHRIKELEGLTESEARAFHLETHRVKELANSLNIRDKNAKTKPLTRSETERATIDLTKHAHNIECKMCVPGSGKKHGHGGAHRKHTRTNQMEANSSDDSSAEIHTENAFKY